MKALSLKQPYASFIAIGKKTIETRTWSTNYRGKLLIAASKSMDKNYSYPNFLSIGLPFGKALAVVELVDCRPMKKEDEESAMYPYRSGLYAWILSDIKKIEPFPVKGQLRLFEVDYKDGIASEDIIRMEQESEKAPVFEAPVWAHGRMRKMGLNPFSTEDWAMFKEHCE